MGRKKKMEVFSMGFKGTGALTATGVGLGLGTSAISSVGGNTTGITAMSGKMPLVAKVYTGGMMVNALGNLNQKIPKRKR